MATIQFLNFDLQIEEKGKRFLARVVSSPVGQAEEFFMQPFTGMELGNLLLKIGHPRSAPKRDLDGLDAVRALGSRLFQRVFTGKVYACFHASRMEAKQKQMGLRVRLRISAAQLKDLPWEFLYNETEGQFLSLAVETPIIRYVDLPISEPSLAVHPPLRILTMISSPSDRPSLDVQGEWHRLSGALALLINSRKVVLDRLEHATLKSLQHQLRKQEYHIFHYIGHGGFKESSKEGVLLLEKDDHLADEVNGLKLGTLLHNHPSMRLVVLNSCEGGRTSIEDPFAGTAMNLVRAGIPAVIAMQFEISDDVAKEFSEELYRALVADTYPVDAAMVEARTAIFSRENYTEWGTPVLFTRSPDGHIFSAQAGVLGQAEVEAFYMKGLAAYWQEDWETARGFFEQVVAIQKDFRDAMALLSEIRAKRGQGTESEKRIKEIYRAGLQAVNRTDWQHALKCFQQVDQVEPDYENTSFLIPFVQQRIKEQSITEDTSVEEPRTHEPVAAGTETQQQAPPKPKAGRKNSQKKEKDSFAQNNVPISIYMTLPASISVETLGGISTPVFRQGSILPLTFKQTFSTAADNQSQVEIHLVYGENRLAKDNISLSRMILDGVPPAPKAVPQIEVSFLVEEDLTLSIEAVIQKTGKRLDFQPINLRTFTIPPVTDPMDQQEKSHSTTYSDPFIGMFNSIYGNGQEYSAVADVFQDITLTLEEAAFGIQKTLYFFDEVTCTFCNNLVSMRTSCTHCGGSGKLRTRKTHIVNIPPGVETGNLICLKGLGRLTSVGKRGDFHLRVTVMEHPLFKRKADNLYLDYPVHDPMPNSNVLVPKLGGGTLPVPDKQKELINRPLVYKGEGVPHLKSEGRGDLVVTFRFYEPGNEEAVARQKRINDALMRSAKGQ